MATTRDLPSVDTLAEELNTATSGRVARPILMVVARDALDGARLALNDDRESAGPWVR